jgi:hypothetical protein
MKEQFAERLDVPVRYVISRPTSRRRTSSIAIACG